MTSTSLSFQSLSARFLSAVWWFFCLVVLVSYLLGLFQQLFRSNSGAMSGNSAVSASKPTLEDLLEDDNVQFGVVTGMATWEMLKVHEYLPCLLSV